MRISEKKGLPHIILTAVMICLLFVPLEKGEFFGSEGDWISQHVGAAEALRQTMLQQGTLFPQHIGIGGGVNAYDLAYYGLLRPEVVLSCLVPNVPMKYIIAGYGVLGAIASVNLCFLWLRRRRLEFWPAMAASVMMAAASCFFHAHHQIMFVNYLPFLIGALMGIDLLAAKGKSLLLTVCVLMICLHSFFYAPACMVVCLLYYLHVISRTEGLDAQAKKRTGLKGALALLTGIGMAAVLLLPTAVDILSTEKDGGSFAEEPAALISTSMEGLLYSAYGCGLTLVALYCLLLSLWDGKRRGLSAAVLTFMLVPGLWLLLSGFLYPREKILIPFLPLIVLICAETLGDLWGEKQRPLVIPVLLCFVPALASRWQPLILAEGTVLLLWVAAARLPAVNVKKIGAAASCLLLAVPLFVSYGVNAFDEDYVRSGDMRQEAFSAEEILQAAEDHRYRFDYLTGDFTCSNFLPDAGLKKTAMYSSVTSSLYAEYCYEDMKNPISIRNRVALLPDENPFFNYAMGLRYVMTSKDKIPYGYTAIREKGEYVIAENKDVLPVCYGAYSIVSEDRWEKAAFPERMIVLADPFGAETRPEPIEGRIEYRDDKPEFIELSCPLPEGKALIISFDIERKDGREVAIYVDGMLNKLSSEKAPYPNENYRFNYVLAARPGTERLKVEGRGGDYEIGNMEIWMADLPGRDSSGEIVMPVSYTELKDGKVFDGSIEMEKDGWFVTSYPYKKGYRALVDGKRVETKKINGAFVGFEIEEGNHTVQISYRAPGFWPGLAISLLSLAAALFTAGRERKK